MSFKNGDRSRAHRLRKLRNKLRLKTRALLAPPVTHMAVQRKQK